MAETIIRPEKIITPEIDREFQELLDSDAQSAEIVKFVDSRLVYPGCPHFNLHQQVWIRDHRMFMGIDQNRKVSLDESFEDYQAKLSPVHHEFYFIKYVQPAFCNPDKYNDFLTWSDGERLWVDGEFDRVKRFAGDESLLVKAIAEVSPILARKIMEEGLCPGAD